MNPNYPQQGPGSIFGAIPPLGSLSGLGSPIEKQQSEIQIAQKCLAESITQAAQIIVGLTERLAPVLKPMPPTTPDQSEKLAESIVSPLGETLRVMRRKIDNEIHAPLAILLERLSL